MTHSQQKARKEGDGSLPFSVLAGKKGRSDGRLTKTDRAIVRTELSWHQNANARGAQAGPHAGEKPRVLERSAAKSDGVNARALRHPHRNSRSARAPRFHGNIRKTCIDASLSLLAERGKQGDRIEHETVGSFHAPAGQGFCSTRAGNRLDLIAAWPS